MTLRKPPGRPRPSFPGGRLVLGPGLQPKAHVPELWAPLLQIKRSSIRKGMVMVSPRLNPQASWEFEAEILVLHHPTTISPRYQAMGRCLKGFQPRSPPF